MCFHLSRTLSVQDKSQAAWVRAAWELIAFDHSAVTEPSSEIQEKLASSDSGQTKAEVLLWKELCVPVKLRLPGLWHKGFVAPAIWNETLLSCKSSGLSTSGRTMCKRFDSEHKCCSLQRKCAETKTPNPMTKTQRLMTRSICAAKANLKQGIHWMDRKREGRASPSLLTGRTIVGVSQGQRQIKELEATFSHREGKYTAVPKGSMSVWEEEGRGVASQPQVHPIVDSHVGGPETTVCGEVQMNTPYLNTDLFIMSRSQTGSGPGPVDLESVDLVSTLS